MVDRDVVLAKLAIIERCLARVEDVHSAPERRSAIDNDDITVVNLERAIQAGIDLATHVVASEGLGLPDTSGASFVLLREAGVLESDLAERLRRMAGFRNIAVHDYRKLDPEIIDQIVRYRLGDLRALGRQIVRRYLPSSSAD